MHEKYLAFKKNWLMLILKRNINIMVSLRLPMLIETLRIKYCRYIPYTNIKEKSETQPCEEKFC